MPAWALILRHWKLALSAVLLIAVGVQTIRVERLQTIVAKLLGQNKALRLNLDQVKVATKQADRAAREAKARTEAEYRAKAERTDDLYQARLASANARADAYARRMRVNPPNSAGRAAPGASSSDAPSPDRSGEGTFVAVSDDDFRILNENTQRLKAAHEWACQQEGAKCEG